MEMILTSFAVALLDQNGFPIDITKVSQPFPKCIASGSGLLGLGATRRCKNPIRGIFDCCASARDPPKMSKIAIANISSHFRFPTPLPWLRACPGYLEGTGSRLPIIGVRNRKRNRQFLVDVFFDPNPKSKIVNPISLDHLIRSRQNVRRHRHTDLLGRSQIDG